MDSSAHNVKPKGIRPLFGSEQTETKDANINTNASSSNSSNTIDKEKSSITTPAQANASVSSNNTTPNISSDNGAAKVSATAPIVAQLSKEKKKPNITSKRGRGGDPRMHRAVAARLANPKLSLLDSLLAGGFVFTGLTDAGNKVGNPNALDDDNVNLAQRKNQLSRRVRLARQALKKKKGKGGGDGEDDDMDVDDKSDQSGDEEEYKSKKEVKSDRGPIDSKRKSPGNDIDAKNKGKQKSSENGLIANLPHMQAMKEESQKILMQQSIQQQQLAMSLIQNGGLQNSNMPPLTVNKKSLENGTLLNTSMRLPQSQVNNLHSPAPTKKRMKMRSDNDSVTSCSIASLHSMHSMHSIPSLTLPVTVDRTRKDVSDRSTNSHSTTSTVKQKTKRDKLKIQKELITGKISLEKSDNAQEIEDVAKNDNEEGQIKKSDSVNSLEALLESDAPLEKSGSDARTRASHDSDDRFETSSQIQMKDKGSGYQHKSVTDSSNSVDLLLEAAACGSQKGEEKMKDGQQDFTLEAHPQHAFSGTSDPKMIRALDNYRTESTSLFKRCLLSAGCPYGDNFEENKMYLYFIAKIINDDIESWRYLRKFFIQYHGIVEESDYTEGKIEKKIDDDFFPRSNKADNDKTPKKVSKTDSECRSTSSSQKRMKFEREMRSLNDSGSNLTDNYTSGSELGTDCFSQSSSHKKSAFSKALIINDSGSNLTDNYTSGSEFNVDYLSTSSSQKRAKFAKQIRDLNDSGSNLTDHYTSGSEFGTDAQSNTSSQRRSKFAKQIRAINDTGSLMTDPYTSGSEFGADCRSTSSSQRRTKFVKEIRAINDAGSNHTDHSDSEFGADCQSNSSSQKRTKFAKEIRAINTLRAKDDTASNQTDHYTSGSEFTKQLDEIGSMSELSNFDTISDLGSKLSSLGRSNVLRLQGKSIPRSSTEPEAVLSLGFSDAQKSLSSTIGSCSFISKDNDSSEKVGKQETDSKVKYTDTDFSKLTEDHGDSVLSNLLDMS